MKHIFRTGIPTILAVSALTVCGAFDKMERLQYAMSLFSGAEQYENFARIPETFPVFAVEASQDAFPWPIGQPTPLPAKFQHDGKQTPTSMFLDETDTVALIVLHEGKIRYEKYWLTGGPDVQWPSWSVAKSYISALVGIAIEDGLIGDVSDSISQYIPELAGTGYDGVSIKDILQMSSGARWNEDYSAFSSDINRLGRILALGGSLDKFITTIGPDLKPGTYNRYSSADTQVLGRLIVKVTGQSISSYMTEKLWSPLRAQSDGYWLIDKKGMEMAFAGFHATARDYARIGELYRNGGVMNGQVIVPSSWVIASTRADAPHLVAGPNPASNNEFGYGYQWWLLDGDEGEFMAMGVYNQFIYVNPARSIVIVKLSANSQFGVIDDQSSYRDQETISLLRAIAAATAREQAELN